MPCTYCSLTLWLVVRLARCPAGFWLFGFFGPATGRFAPDYLVCRCRRCRRSTPVPLFASVRRSVRVNRISTSASGSLYGKTRLVSTASRVACRGWQSGTVPSRRSAAGYKSHLRYKLQTATELSLRVFCPKKKAGRFF